MVRTISKVALAGLGLLALAVFTPQAKANAIDTFSCSGVGLCGSVVVSGSGTVFSTLGIPTTDITFPQQVEEVGDSFNLAFNTSAGSISLTDTTDADATLVGTITSFTFTPAAANCTACDGTLTLNVNWYNEALLQANSTLVLNVAGGIAVDGTYSVEATQISATTPEPASLLLLGTGLLGLGGVARRRWSN